MKSAGFERSAEISMRYGETALVCPESRIASYEPHSDAIEFDQSNSFTRMTLSPLNVTKVVRAGGVP